ncbi:hypothetical protein [Bradyrhizobium stylosanthis]|uniref:hypothetical protein n=1 Tax=Bradyrhizobium stylosanthis TaxID=1803665 RepID=UPI00119F940B|nr:hypothetical protein [Bradyrhizobium stylosanthis]
MTGAADQLHVLRLMKAFSKLKNPRVRHMIPQHVEKLVRKTTEPDDPSSEALAIETLEGLVEK